MIAGFLFGLSACLLWGGIYLVPLMLPAYDPAVIATGRFIAFGLVTLPLWRAWRSEFAHYELRDWRIAAQLGIVGNCVYYWCLTQCIQKAGAPLAGMCMALIPVLVAVIANARDRKRGRFVPWRKLFLPLVVLFAGLVLANCSEFEAVSVASGGAVFWEGAVYGVAALLIWTWFPIVNADWLIEHPERSPKAWTTAQGITTLPAAVVGFSLAAASQPEGTAVLGVTPWLFVTLMLFSGVICSWLGNVFWAEMSRRLPTALAGQMIVFETIFAVSYAHLYRQSWPETTMILGLVLLIAGVLLSLRVFRRKI